MFHERRHFREIPNKNVPENYENIFANMLQDLSAV